jgi:hypothetical protein
VNGEQPEPFELTPGPTSRYGPLFWTCLVIGGAVMGFGLVSLLSKAGATDPPNVAAFLLGLALAHDLLIAPAVIGAAVLLRRVTPRAARGALFGAIAVSAIVVLFAVPLVAGWGRQADNPSLLPRDYGYGLLVVLAAIWAVAAAMLARGRHDGSPRPVRRRRPP